MKALVLAAGFGTRLKPWTDQLPKPLIPVAGIEPLFFALAKLQAAGINDIFVNGHHLYRKIEESLELFSNLLPGTRLRFSHEKDQILGTGGAIRKVLAAQANFTRGLVVMNGDTLAQIDIARLFTEGQSTFGVSYDPKYLQNYAALSVDPEGRWVAPGDSAPGTRPAHFLGVHYLSAADVLTLQSKQLPATECDLFNGIYVPLSAEGRRPRAIEFLRGPEEFWIDLNKKEFFDDARELVRDRFAPLWNELLRKRHPTLSLEKAREYWPV